MNIKDVSAATMYDVLHDGQYRVEWDPAMKESFDIARLSANADVGYYSCEYTLPAPRARVCVCARAVQLRARVRSISTHLLICCSMTRLYTDVL